MSDPWNDCPEHDWDERVDSMFSNEFHVEVRCKNCGAPGELDLKDDCVFWPAT